MPENMTDEEQLQVLKNWWKENGRFLLGIVVAALAAYFGWQGWTRHQQDYTQEASALYTELLETIATPEGEALADDKRKTAQFLIEQLQNDYGKTLNAVNATLLGAKLAVDNDDLDGAEAQLQIALESADEDMKPLVALRLAKVYFAKAQYDDALALLNYEKDDGFTGLYSALKGDVLAAQGDKAAAQAAYEEALTKLTVSNNFERRRVEMKLADIVAGE